MAYQSLNPYDGKIFKTFDELTDEQLETAVHSAAQCFETWRHTTFAERSAVLTRAAAILRERVEDFARQMATHTDPVCGMKVDDQKGKSHSTYQEKTSEGAHQ